MSMIDSFFEAFNSSPDINLRSLGFSLSADCSILIASNGSTQARAHGVVVGDVNSTLAALWSPRSLVRLRRGSRSSMPRPRNAGGDQPPGTPPLRICCFPSMDAKRTFSVRRIAENIRFVGNVMIDTLYRNRRVRATRTFRSTETQAGHSALARISFHVAA